MTLLLSLLVAVAGQADPPCTAATSAGWVASLERARRGGSERPTRTSAGGTTQAIEPADLLCEGDLIRNPASSPFIVRLRLGSRIAMLRAGEPPYRIARPGWIAAAGDWAGGIIEALDAYTATRRSLATTGVRGPEGECQVSPAARGLTDNYVVADVPIRIAWNCGDHGVEVRAAVTSGGRMRALRPNGNVLTLDIARHCQSACTLVIATRSGQVIARERLVAIPRARLPLEILRAIRSGPGASAMNGARLVEGERPWRLLGASLLWAAACSVPAAAVASSALYGFGDPERFCEAKRGGRPVRRRGG